MIYGLTEKDLERVDKNVVEKMILNLKSRLNLWSLPNHEKENIKKEIKELEELLEKGGAVLSC